jgi:hypothetical protein
MPSFNPSTHDDLIDISITLSQVSRGAASFTTVLVLVDNVTPGGGLYAEYASASEVTADISNLNTTCEAIAGIMFGQINPPEKILIGKVDLAGSQTAAAALDLIVADGADFYGVTYANRTPARQVALAAHIEDLADNGTFLLLGLQDDDSSWLDSGIPAAWSSVAGFERTVVYYHDDNDADAVSDYLDCAHFADRLAWDPDEKSAGWNSTVSEVDALTTAVTQTQKGFLRANYANVALPFGTRTSTFVDPGKTLAGRPVNHVVSVDWLRARLNEGAADLITAKSERGEKITCDAQGQALLGNVIEGKLQTGVSVGHFLGYNLRAITINSADIAAERCRFTIDLQLATGVRTVTIGIYAGTDPVA